MDKAPEIHRLSLCEKADVAGALENLIVSVIISCW